MEASLLMHTSMQTPDTINIGHFKQAEFTHWHMSRCHNVCFSVPVESVKAADAVDA